MQLRLAMHKQERNQLRGMRSVKAKHILVRVMRCFGAFLARRKNKRLAPYESAGPPAPTAPASLHPSQLAGPAAVWRPPLALASWEISRSVTLGEKCLDNFCPRAALAVLTHLPD